MDWGSRVEWRGTRIWRAAEHFPEAQLCFDRFHVMKLCGESLDEIRKKVAREHGGLPRGAMWALRGNPENLKEEQRNLREQICREHGKIARPSRSASSSPTCGTMSTVRTPSNTLSRSCPGAAAPGCSLSSNSARLSVRCN